MKKINKRGFTIKEFMFMLAFLAILIAIGTKIVLDCTKSYGSFKTLANTFANAVAKYKDQVILKEEYSLYEVEQEEFIEEITNPFDKSEVCDKYESFVEMPEINTKKVTLLCGNYLTEALQNEYYNIYEVSEWSKTKEEGYNDNSVVYNFKLNGNLMLKEDVTERTFIQKYNEVMGEVISNPNDLNSKKNVELVSNVVYREKKLVKEFK